MVQKIFVYIKCKFQEILLVGCTSLSFFGIIQYEGRGGMMKKYYKYIFIVAFIILPFLFINSVQAETTYKATVKYVEGAKCNLYSGSLKSSGFCYYANSNLNSYVPGVIWLDAGDEVIVHPDKRVATKDSNLCSGDYVYTDFSFKGNPYHGYYCSTNLNTGNLLTDELKEKFKSAGFPEDYWQKLCLLYTSPSPRDM